MTNALVIYGAGVTWPKPPTSEMKTLDALAHWQGSQYKIDNKRSSLDE